MEKNKVKKVEATPIGIPKPSPPLLHRLKKKEDEGKFNKFMAMLKKLKLNVHLVDILEQMLRYAKFMKELMTKKRTMSYEPMDSLHHLSTTTTDH